VQIPKVHGPLLFHDNLNDALGYGLLLDAMRKEDGAKNVQVNKLVDCRMLVYLRENPYPTLLPLGIIVLFRDSSYPRTL
jgi:hypothetical protein